MSSLLSRLRYELATGAVLSIAVLVVAAAR